MNKHKIKGVAILEFEVRFEANMKIKFICIILFLSFYPYLVWSVNSIDKIKWWTACVFSVMPLETSTRPSFNQPLDRPDLQQMVLFLLEGGGFGYGRVIDISEDQVQVSFRSVHPTASGRTYDPLSGQSMLTSYNIYMMEDANEQHEWVSMEFLRRPFLPGDFIRFNPKRLGDIYHGRVVSVDKSNMFVHIERLGARTEPYSLWQRLFFERVPPILGSSNLHVLTPFEILEVIDGDPDEYWQRLRDTSFTSY